MKKGENRKQLHVISTGKQSEEEFVKKIVAIDPWVDFIHLRERQWTAQQHIDVIRKLMASGIRSQKIIINDRVDVASMMQVGGVQLASHSIDASVVRSTHPSLQIGCSIHDEEEAVMKERAGADYILFGHVFSTFSKPGIPPRGVAKLQLVVRRVSIPVIAIGGITPEYVQDVLPAGAQGIAVLSGVLLANDARQAAQQYRHALDGGDKK